ncbi:MAG: holo-ACP synthase [Planctomycetes bacterium]|nr:holo-ACP synthase [Planctomycetota bacterium]
MAIIGIGTDIVAVSRIARMLEEKREDFVARVYTQREVKYCEAQARPNLHFAARFAAKEALMKALGTGWAEGVGFNQIGVANRDDGGPEYELSGRALELLEGENASRVWLSLSHTDDFAVATAVIETAMEGKRSTRTRKLPGSTRVHSQR